MGDPSLRLLEVLVHFAFKLDNSSKFLNNVVFFVPEECFDLNN